MHRGLRALGLLRAQRPQLGVQRLAHLLGLRVDGGGGALQALGHLGLLCQLGLRGVLPLLLQGLAQLLQAVLPGALALGVLRVLRGGLRVLCAAQLRQPGLAARLQLLLVGLQAVLRLLEQGLQLLGGALDHALVLHTALLGHVGQGGLHHRADAVAGHLQALPQGLAQGLVDRPGQFGVAASHFAVEGVLLARELCAQLLAELLAVARHVRHQILQLLRHHWPLPLLQPE